MAKYVDVEKLKKDGWYAQRNYRPDFNSCTIQTREMTDFEEDIVRCADCAFAQEDKIFGQIWCLGERVGAGWFCPDGKRRGVDYEV